LSEGIRGDPCRIRPEAAEAFIGTVMLGGATAREALRMAYIDPYEELNAERARKALDGSPLPAELESQLPGPLVLQDPPPAPQDP